jgi:uncharacterized protein YbbC (DUF1343 family)
MKRPGNPDAPSGLTLLPDPPPPPEARTMDLLSHPAGVRALLRRLGAGIPLATVTLVAVSTGQSQTIDSSETVTGTATALTGAASSAGGPSGRVLPGLEVLARDSLHLVAGKRVGFITNHTSVASDGRSGIEVLREMPGVRLTALYAPEHGLTGTAHGGAWIASGRDAATGIRVHSLYGRTQKPTPEMLRDIDVLVFDMQDVGARPYTYVWTMAMALEAAAGRRVPFVVLDRPNPITGSMEGPLMQFEMRTMGQPITGYYPVPLRHGMTVGEIARYINAEFGIGAELSVVPVDGWRSGQWYDQTLLPWVNPSPNIRSADAALLYSGLVMLEAVNLSVGRGTDSPFSYVGAPWLDLPALMDRLRGYDLPGVAIDTARIVPSGAGWVPFRGQPVRAVRLRITDRDEYRPVLTALVLLAEIRRLHPRDVGIGSMLQMLGSRWAREALVRGDDPRAIVRRWEEENAAWMVVRNRYRLYPGS